MVAQFWWGQKQGERKIHWVAWRKLCRPKDEGGIGFRDFKLFNWALLGKQAWRLLTKPGSLLETVLKARYYPNSSFLEVDLGTLPSYTWRGLWEARWVVRRGMRWRVGNGKDIRMWTDPWIPDTQTRKLLSPRGNSPIDFEVGKLIDPVSRTWNAELVSQLVAPFEQARVLSIPLSNKLPEDKLCWDLERDGEYSVRSAYRALFRDEWTGVEVATSNPHTLWHKIWSLKTLPRVKLFGWRACQNALPTRVGIGSRVAGYEKLCGVCGKVDEDVLHALKECSQARAIMGESRFAHTLSWRCCSVLDWWDRSFQELDMGDMEDFMTVCWAVWGARNRAVMEGEAAEPHKVLSYATKVSEEVRDEGAMKHHAGAAVQQHATTWSKPGIGWVKINVDAGVLGDVGTGLGVVVRDDEGKVVGCAVWQGSEQWETRATEAKAILLGLKVGKEMGCRRVVVESDCLSVVQALRSGSTGISSFALVIDDVLDLCSFFDVVSWSFVKRSGNKVAHILAHFQPWEFGERVWVDEIPDCCLIAAEADLLI